ncbi:MAG: SsrA-binding protein SmpB [Dehalococcoidia bacterium]|jgi:SsrA-binding protein|nr:SsrA-binding protein SmpB [Dehalococcoidia bacterium]
MPRRVVGRERTAVTDVGTRYKTIAQNRRARFNYDIGEQFEAGIVLSGTEIKSVREGRVNIAEAYARVRAGELWLMNAHIAEFKGASHYSEHDTLRPRKLLIHKKELRRLELELGRERSTLVPLRLYLKDHHAKVEIAVAKGRRQYDRRNAIKERETKRDMQRATRLRDR